MRTGNEEMELSIHYEVLAEDTLWCGQPEADDVTALAMFTEAQAYATLSLAAAMRASSLAVYN